MHGQVAREVEEEAVEAVLLRGRQSRRRLPLSPATASADGNTSAGGPAIVDGSSGRSGPGPLGSVTSVSRRHSLVQRFRLLAAPQAVSNLKSQCESEDGGLWQSLHASGTAASGFTLTLNPLVESSARGGGIQALLAGRADPSAGGAGARIPRNDGAAES